LVSGSARQRSISFVGYFSEDSFRIPVGSYGQVTGFEFDGHKRGKLFESDTNAKLIINHGLHIPHIDITGLKVLFTVTI
jgi:hypothetical protein